MYGPVDEEVSQECEVEGVLPEAVYGEFARNGPNPRFAPARGYHWFDGDGMVRIFLYVGDDVQFSCVKLRHRESS